MCIKNPHKIEIIQKWLKIRIKCQFICHDRMMGNFKNMNQTLIQVMEKLQDKHQPTKKETMAHQKVSNQTVMDIILTDLFRQIQ